MTTRKRWILGGAALAWALLVALLVLTIWKDLARPFEGESDSRPAAVAISVLPGLALFGYVILRPQKRNLVCLAIAIAAGLGGHGLNAYILTTETCKQDPLCGMQIAVPPGLEVVGFVALWSIGAASRKAGTNAGGEHERQKPVQS